MLSATVLDSLIIQPDCSKVLSWVSAKTYIGMKEKKTSQIWDVIPTVSAFWFSDGTSRNEPNTSRWCRLESHPHSCCCSLLPSQKFWQDKTETPEWENPVMNSSFTMSGHTNEGSGFNVVLRSQLNTCWLLGDYLNFSRIFIKGWYAFHRLKMLMCWLKFHG